MHEGSPIKRQSFLNEMTEKVFDNLDKNKDGLVSLEEHMQHMNSDEADDEGWMVSRRGPFTFFVSLLALHAGLSSGKNMSETNLMVGTLLLVPGLHALQKQCASPLNSAIHIQASLTWYIMQGCADHRGIRNVYREPSWYGFKPKHHKVQKTSFDPS